MHRPETMPGEPPTEIHRQANRTRSPLRAPAWRPEVHRGNGVGVVLSGAAVLVLIGALLTPWWSCAFSYQGDQISLTVYPGLTFDQTCMGQNCTWNRGTDTYSSAGLTQTGSVMQGSENALGFALFAGTACFFSAVITWADRARLGAVRTTMGAAAVAGALSLLTPILVSQALPNAFAADLSGLGGVQNSGPLGGWMLMFVAAVLFVAAAASEWTTLRYAQPWDAPLSVGPAPTSKEEPPVTTPPDRVRRVERLWKQGAITSEDFEAQKARILDPGRLADAVPIPPNSGSRKAARAHIEYLQDSGRFTPVQLEAHTEKVLRAYGLSADFRFPEEEIQALLIRQRAGTVGKEEFDRRKQEILDRI